MVNQPEQSQSHGTKEKSKNNLTVQFGNAICFKNVVETGRQTRDARIDQYLTRMRPKILLVDDDKDLLELYQEMLSGLPSRPEIFTSTSGARGLAMLEADTFTILVCDLNMPKMDGLQVLSIVRRKHPEVRTVVLTSVLDEQFRSRVYGLGVDLFWQKPASMEETKQFLECIESLVGREQGSGFRGVQSKSLVDLIQLECLSQNSTVLKITNGPLTGRIWIQTGEVIDAATDDLSGEPAFHRILSWKAGTFESLPAEPHRTRAIVNSYQGLLLETAQAQDEAKNQPAAEAEANSPLSAMARHPHVEYAMVLKPASETPNFESRGLENSLPVADWARHTLGQFRALGERIQAGPLQHVDGISPQSHVAMASSNDLDFCIGWDNALSADELRESMKKVLSLWVS
jgi:CheY-like chemotaxis protein